MVNTQKHSPHLQRHQVRGSVPEKYSPSGRSARVMAYAPGALCILVLVYLTMITKQVKVNL